MIAIAFPSPAFRIRQQNNVDEIFDQVRKRWLVLTPEEWVRQNFIAYLIQEIGVPASLISIEREIAVGELKKRFDLVVYGRNGVPWMLLECKAMEVQLSDKTIGQILSYFSGMPARFAMITNGSYTYGWKIFDGECVPLKEFPPYPVVFPDTL